MLATFTIVSIDAQSSEKFELPDTHAPYIEVKQGDALPPCFSSHTASKCPFHGMFGAMFLHFGAFYW